MQQLVQRPGTLVYNVFVDRPFSWMFFAKVNDVPGKPFQVEQVRCTGSAKSNARNRLPGTHGARIRLPGTHGARNHLPSTHEAEKEFFLSSCHVIGPVRPGLRDWNHDAVMFMSPGCNVAYYVCRGCVSGGREGVRRRGHQGRRRCAAYPPVCARNVEVNGSTETELNGAPPVSETAALAQRWHSLNPKSNPIRLFWP